MKKYVVKTAYGRFEGPTLVGVYTKRRDAGNNSSSVTIRKGFGIYRYGELLDDTLYDTVEAAEEIIKIVEKNEREHEEWLAKERRG